MKRVARSAAVRVDLPRPTGPHQGGREELGWWAPQKQDCEIIAALTVAALTVAALTVTALTVAAMIVIALTVTALIITA